MENFGAYIRTLRESAKLPLRKLASSLDIDQSTLSKIERGERQFTSEMIPKIAKVFSIDFKDLQIRFLSEKLFKDLADENFAYEALKRVEEKLQKLN